MSIEESLEEEEMTPKGKRKFSESEEEKNEVGAVRNGEDGSNKTNAEDKCEYKLANLNFVRKLCSSIENLVESTSNYSKKFFSERKLNKDFYLSMKKSEEPMLKKDVEDIGKEISKQFKCKKNVTFGVKGQNFTEPIKYAELNNSKVKKQEKSRGPLEITLEVREKEEDDCSKLKLLSASGCRTNDSSLESPETCKVSDSVKEETEFIMNCSDRLEDCCETPIERLHTYLNNCSDALLDKVVLHPTGRENSDKESGLQEEKKEVAFDDCRYVEVTENLVKRLNLDSKEKDVPYHKIIKSTALGQRRLQSSCLQI